MKILITAANGQLGTDAAAFFAGRGDEVVAYKDVELDVTDREKVMKAVTEAKPDVVLNCAAITNVDGCERDEALADRVNAEGAGIVARAAQAAGSALVHISTDYVFDGSGTAPYRETDPTCPDSAYGRSKLKGERQVLAACASAYILRTAWLYGPHGNNFVKTMLRLGREKGSVRVVTDQVGNPTSTFELIRIIDAVLRAGKPGVYHATCSGVCSWNEFAREIFRVAGLDVAVGAITSEELDRPAKRPAYSNLSKEKLERECGYRPADWRDALREYFAYREA